jgi:tripartite-type tricarboxylate transporter receptor subunit TctC
MRTGLSVRAALGAVAFGLCMIATQVAALEQQWPSRAVKFVVGFPAGGLTDLFARAYGDHVFRRTGQPVVVENRPGAYGSIAAQAVLAAPADGYTFLFALTGTLVQNRILIANLPYDPDNDFVLISSMFSGHLPFIAAKSTGVTNLKEFVEYARTREVSVGTWGAGSAAHIVVNELNKQYGLKLVPVHYRGEAPMWQDFNVGVLQAGMGSYVIASGVLESGAGRAIAVPSPTRMKKMPEVATFLEQGATSKYFGLKGSICLVGARGTPQEIVNRLSELMVEGGKERARAENPRHFRR